MNAVLQAIRRASPLAIVLLAAISASAQDARSLFHLGYYLQNERQDADGALAAYEQALSANPSREIQEQIRRQMGKIQGVILSHQLARLMPPDALAYVEIAEPARHLENIARSMGLTGRTPSDHAEPVTIPLEDGLAISSDFQISPALFSELKKVHGAALAVTGISDQGPRGLLLIHPGTSDLIRGLMDTGLQVVPQDNSIGGHATFHLQNQVWIVRTASLILCSTEREQIEQALARLGTQGKSLFDTDSFVKTRHDREGALAFAMVDGPRLVKELGPHLAGEAAAARLLLDLDNLLRVTLAITTDEHGPNALARVTYAEGHHSLAYGLIRTEPFGSRALSQVPQGAALIAAVGMNPAANDATPRPDAAMHLTGLDIGRELFANIAEVSLFVLPSKAASEAPAPNLGIVVASHDANKSEALWNQLLSLPASLGMADGPQVSQSLIQGKHARTYQFDKKAPGITLLRWNADTLVAGTTQAVLRLVESGKQGRSALDDPVFANSINDRGDHTSKAVFANVGRLLELGMQMERNEKNAAEMDALRKVLANLTVTWTSSETPTELAMAVKVSNLPLFEDILRVVAQHQGAPSTVASN